MTTSRAATLFSFGRFGFMSASSPHKQAPPGSRPSGRRNPHWGLRMWGGRDSLFPFIAERIQVIWDGIYQAMRRFFLMLSWWPFLLSALMPFVSDGLARRKVKQSNFDYSSPLAHRYSFFALLGVLYLLLIGLTFPFPVQSSAMPVVCGAIVVAVNVYLAPTQKRV